MDAVREQDRTMVGNCHHAACRRKEAARNHAELMGSTASYGRGHCESRPGTESCRCMRGLDVRKLLPRQRREKCFLLTSPFIEPGNGHCLRGMKQRARQTKLTIAPVVHSSDLATAMICNVKGARDTDALVTPSKSEAVIAPNTMRSPAKEDLHVIDAEMKMENSSPKIRMESCGTTADRVMLSHDSTATNNRPSPTTTPAVRLSSIPRPEFICRIPPFTVYILLFTFYCLHSE